MQKLTKKLSLVMVALMTVFTALSYMPAKAATVAPKVQFLANQKLEYTSGDRVTLKVSSAPYAGRVQYRALLWNDSTKSYSDLWTVGDRYYTAYQPTGGTTFEIGWPITEPGSYRLTVLVKRAGIANSKTAQPGNNCDSFIEGPAFVVKPAAVTPAIAPIADVTVEQGATPVLPTEVTINVADGTTKTAKVTWAAVDTSKVGTFAVEGTVEGTEEKAKVNVIVTAKVANVKSVASIDNNRVEVTFDNAVTNIVVADFAVANAAGTAVEVKAVTVRGDNTKVLVDTADMTAGAQYTITYGGVAKSFVSKPADATKPALSLASGVTNRVVRVVFTSTDLDVDTLVNPANYTIADLTVESVVVDEDYNDANPTTTAVLVSVSAQTAGKLYTLKVNSVKDLAGNAITADSSKKFAGLAADATAPALLTVYSEDGNTVIVKFTEGSMLDVASATNIANYSIADLTITAAEIVEGTNVLGGTPEVVLYTSAQTAGKLYTLKMNNVADTFGNVPTAEKTKNFGGTALDTNKIGLSTVAATNNTKVKVVFNDKTDASALNIANYTIADLTVTAAEYLVDGAGVTHKDTVILTTSAQTTGKLYTLTVANILDKAGNALSTATSKKFAGVAADTTAPGVSSFSVNANAEIVIVFNEDVDSASATNVLNYTFNNDLGFATSAVLGSDNRTVTLTTAAQTAGKIYKVTILNVADTNGNAVTTKIEKSFAGIAETAEIQVDSAVALDKHTVKLYFNQAIASLVKADIAVINESINAVVGTDIANNDNADVAPFTTLAGETVDVSLNAAHTEATVTFQSTKAMTAGQLYKVVVTGVIGKFGAPLDTDANYAEFGGINTAKEVKLDLVTVVDANHVDLVFNQDVATTAVANDIVLYKEGALTTPLAIDSVVASGTYDNIIRIKMAAPLTNNSVYYVEIVNAAKVTDVSAYFNVKNDVTSQAWEAAFATPSFGTVTLVADVAIQEESNVITVHFNKGIQLLGGFDATVIDVKDDAGNIAANVTFAAVDASDSTILRLFTDADLAGSASGVYTVALGVTNVQDKIAYELDSAVLLSGNTTAADKAPVFAKGISDAKPEVSDVVAVASDIARITFSERVKDIATLTAADITVMDANGNVIPVIIATTSALAAVPTAQTGALDRASALYIKVAGTFAQGQTYTVVIPTTNSMTDLEGNALAGTAAIEVDFSGVSVADASAPTAAKNTDTANTLGLTFNENVISVVINADTVVEAITPAFNAAVDMTAATFTIANAGAVNTEYITFTIKDIAGNTATYKATFDGTNWTVVAQ